MMLFRTTGHSSKLGFFFIMPFVISFAPAGFKIALYTYKA